MIDNSYNHEKDITIISYDPNKTWLEELNNQVVFRKQSSETEKNSIELFAKQLENKNLLVFDKKFGLNVPKIYDWNKDNKILTMEYCEGVNLEFLLRDTKTYDYGRTILDKLLKFMIDNKFYWVDFAPRNVLINDDKITLVDFEKGFEAKDTRDYLRNHVYEEYGSFTFLEDRMYNPDEVFDTTEEEEEYLYVISEIGPKRIKTVAGLLGYTETLTRKEYLSIIKMFIIAEEPYKDSDKVIFPRVELEKVLKDKETNPEAFINYANIIIDINKNKGNEFVTQSSSQLLVRRK